MRLVSQDKETDIQYERALLYISEGNEVAAMCNGEIWVMGIYETHKRAREVMREVQDVYYKYGSATIHTLPEK